MYFRYTKSKISWEKVIKKPEEVKSLKVAMALNVSEKKERSEFNSNLADKHRLRLDNSFTLTVLVTI